MNLLFNITDMSIPSNQRSESVGTVTIFFHIPTRLGYSFGMFIFLNCQNKRKVDRVERPNPSIYMNIEHFVKKISRFVSPNQ